MVGEEVRQLYEKCGLPITEDFQPRTTINTGMLNNRLNSDFSFLTRNAVGHCINSVNTFKQQF